MVEGESNKGLEWGQIIGTSCLTLLVSFLAGVSVYYVIQKEPDLVYEVFPIASFDKDGRRTAIINATIGNVGTKPTTEVICSFDFPPSAQIQDKKVSPSNSLAKYEWVLGGAANERRIEIPKLLAGDEFRFSFLVENMSDGEVRLNLRSKDLNGREQSLRAGGSSSIQNLYVFILLVVMVTLAFIAAMLAVQRVRREH